MNDLIERQAAIDLARDICIPTKDGSIYRHRCIDPDAVRELPSAQPERKNGHWEMVPDPYGFFDEIPVCSECGCTTEMRKTYKFCPNCGADMRGGQNETD